VQSHNSSNTTSTTQPRAGLEARERERERAGTRGPGLQIVSHFVGTLAETSNTTYCVLLHHSMVIHRANKRRRDASKATSPTCHWRLLVHDEPQRSLSRLPTLGSPHSESHCPVLAGIRLHDIICEPRTVGISVPWY
jgi:hypothetical protein